MKSLKLSVVVPVYNEEKLIHKCLDALYDQKLPIDEVIMVDNNSIDSTVKIASQYSGLKIIKEKKQGISYARTTGFNSAKGDVIARIDADTIVSPNWSSTIVNNFQNDTKIDALTGDAAIAELSPGKTFFGSFFYANFRKNHQKEIGIKPIMYGFNCAIKKDAWNRIKDSVTLGDSLVTEDLDLSICAKKANLKIKYDKNLIVKCHVIRSLDIKKIKRYKRTDHYTLVKHGIASDRQKEYATIDEL
jgi:glycosyltransferase involved in cell wall biosynthesis